MKKVTIKKLALTLALTYITTTFTIPYPMVGHYNSELYEFMNIIAEINLDRFPAQKIDIQAICPIKNPENPTYNIIILETKNMDNSQTLIAAPWNIIFHPWIIKLRQDIGESINNFSVNVPMGVFEANGIVPQDIGNNTLQPLAVNPHDIHYSPNNAQIMPDGNRSIYTFWTQAQYNNQNIISFIMIINNDLLSQSIMYKMQEDPDITYPAQFFNYLETCNKFIEQAQDQEAYKTFITKCMILFPQNQEYHPVKHKKGVSRCNLDYDYDYAMKDAIEASCNDQIQNDEMQQAIDASLQMSPRQKIKLQKAQRAVEKAQDNLDRLYAMELQKTEEAVAKKTMLQSQKSEKATSSKQSRKTQTEVDRLLAQEIQQKEYKAEQARIARTKQEEEDLLLATELQRQEDEDQ